MWKYQFHFDIDGINLWAVPFWTSTPHQFIYDRYQFEPNQSDLSDYLLDQFEIYAPKRTKCCRAR